jgi:threonine synthase
VLATNANRVISDYIDHGKFEPKPSVATIANAMDVGNPSNFERLSYLYSFIEEFRSEVRAYSVNDEQIKTIIKEVYQEFNYLVCPHTATGYYARKKLSQDQAWIIAATAAPCKFETVIEPIIGSTIPVDAQLTKLMSRAQFGVEVAADIKEVQQALANKA